MRDPELEMAVDEICNLNTNRDPTEKEMYEIYCWIDHLEFSRPKRNMSRDFCDGVLMAELISMYLPRFVELRYYYAGLSRKNKANNWEHLNMKVFSKLGYKIGKQQMNEIMESVPGSLEKVLFQLRSVIARKNRSILNYRVGKKPEAPEIVSNKAPLIPSAATYSTSIKRRERSVSSQSRAPQTPAKKVVVTSPPAITTHRPTTSYKPPVKNVPRTMTAGGGGGKVLPNNIKIVTLEPITTKARGSVSSSPSPHIQHHHDLQRNVDKSPHPPRQASKSPHPKRQASKSPNPSKGNSDSTKQQQSIGQAKRIMEQVPEAQPVKRIPEEEAAQPPAQNSEAKPKIVPKRAPSNKPSSKPELSPPEQQPITIPVGNVQEISPDIPDLTWKQPEILPKFILSTELQSFLLEKETPPESIVPEKQEIILPEQQQQQQQQIDVESPIVEKKEETTVDKTMGPASSSQVIVPDRSYEKMFDEEVFLKNSNSKTNKSAVGISGGLTETEKENLHRQRMAQLEVMKAAKVGYYYGLV